MNPELWLNNTDPDLEAIGRYADPTHDECEGMGVWRECGEWEFCSCTQAALLAAAEEPIQISIRRQLSLAERNAIYAQTGGGEAYCIAADRAEMETLPLAA